MSDNTNAATVVPENNEDNTNQLSEQQEQVLANVETEATAEEPTTEDEGLVEASTAYDEISEAWANDKLDDKGIVAAVDNGTISEDQLVAITGDTLAEIRERIAESDQPKISEPLYSFEAAKDHLMRRIKESEGRLNAGGAIALTQVMLSRHEISQETATKLVEMLSVGNTDGSVSTSNTISEEQMILEDIKEHFKPTESIDEAKAGGRAIVSGLLKQQVEFEGSKSSLFVMHLANIAIYLFNRGELTITRRGEADISKKRPWMATTHEKLWAKIKEDRMFGEVLEDVDKIGSGESAREKSFGKVLDPYNDKFILPIVKLACMKACLVAYASVSGVQWGYRKKAQVQGRPSRKMEFASSVPEGEEKAYYKMLCAPWTILKPYEYGFREVQKERITDSGKSSYTVVESYRLSDNNDPSLRWIPDEMVEPLYQHHFAGHVLTYHTEERGTKRIPLGEISGSHDPRFPPMERKRESTQETLDKVKTLSDRVNVLTAERDAAQGGLDPENIVRTLQGIAGKARNKHLPMTATERATALEVAYDVIVSRLTNGEKPSEGEVRQLARIKTAIEAILTDKTDGIVEWRSANGANSLRTNVAA